VKLFVVLTSKCHIFKPLPRWELKWKFTLHVRPQINYTTTTYCFHSVHCFRGEHCCRHKIKHEDCLSNNKNWCAVQVANKILVNGLANCMYNSLEHSRYILQALQFILLCEVESVDCWMFNYFRDYLEHLIDEEARK
jgi:hypothetical protein